MNEEGVTPIPREARPYQGQRAGLVTRLIAAIIDVLVVVAVLSAGYVALAGLRFVLDPQSFQMPATSVVLSLSAGFVVLVVYLTAAWSSTGRTYGCHVMGLRVVNFRGQRLRFAGALARAVFYAVFPVGLFWCAASRGHRSLQDTLLRTSVIYDWQPRPSSPAGPQR